VFAGKGKGENTCVVEESKKKKKKKKGKLFVGGEEKDIFK